MGARMGYRLAALVVRRRRGRFAAPFGAAFRVALGRFKRFLITVERSTFSNTLWTAESTCFSSAFRARADRRCKSFTSLLPPPPEIFDRLTMSSAVFRMASFVKLASPSPTSNALLKRSFMADPYVISRIEFAPLDYVLVSHFVLRISLRRAIVLRILDSIRP